MSFESVQDLNFRLGQSILPEYNFCHCRGGKMTISFPVGVGQVTFKKTHVQSLLL